MGPPVRLPDYSESVTGELWLALSRKPGVELPEILGGHQQRLSERLQLDGARVIRRRLAVEHLLGHRQAPRSELLQPGDVLRHRRVLLTLDPAAQQERFRRPAEADDPRQQPADTHIAARESDAGEEKTEARGCGENPDIGRSRDHRPSARRDPVDRGDYRLRNLPKVANA